MADSPLDPSQDFVALRPRGLDSWNDNLLFLLAKEPMFTCMRVEAKHTDLGFTTTDASHRLCAQLNRVEDTLLG